MYAQCITGDTVDVMFPHSSLTLLYKEMHETTLTFK